MAILSRAAMKAKLDLLLPSSKDGESVIGEIMRSLFRDHIDSGGNSTATATSEGVVELATDAETITGTATDRVVTPANLEAKVASVTESGVVEIATSAEGNTGTDAARALSPDGYAGSNLGKRTFSVDVFGPLVDTATGDGKQHWNTPAEIAGMNLVAVSASHGVVGTTGQTDIQIHNLTQTADMLSTVISIDTGQPSSTTASTPAVIDAAEDDITAGDVLRFDVDAICSGTAAKGITVNLTFQLP